MSQMYCIGVWTLVCEYPNFLCSILHAVVNFVRYATLCAQILRMIVVMEA